MIHHIFEIERERMAMDDKNFLTDMAYEDYAVLIAHMDGELYFRKEREKKKPLLDTFTKPCDFFSDQSRKYREGMVEYWNAFKKQPQQNEDPYRNFLYNPVSFVTFGDTDSISVVVVDDFDPVVNLTSKSMIPIRQTCLAFCPTLESLKLKSLLIDTDSTNPIPIFCDIRDLCTPRNVETGQNQNQRKQLSLFDSPLISVNYFKLNGMAVLGPGLLFQQAIYRAMAKKIVEVLKDLCIYAPEAEKKGFFSKSDVESFRCIFLDPQGWSDVCTLMFSRNYSVTMSIIVALRQLTFNHLYGTEEGAQLEDAVNCFGVHKRIADESVRIAKKRGEHVDPDPLLRNNHVFCSTYSTLGVSATDFKQENVQCNGFVIANTNLEIDPGHLSDACTAAGKKEKKKAKPVDNLSKDKEFTWCIVGQGDSSFPHLINKEHGEQRPVRLVDLLNQIINIRDCDDESMEDPDACFAPHILEICTSMEIPILFASPKDKMLKHGDMRSVLSLLEERLFINSKGTFSLTKLYASLRKIRISAPLSHCIINLFTDFASCIGDPFLFERVLDLYDIFATSYKLLAQELPSALMDELKELNKGQDIPANYHICRAFLSNDDIENLVELVELLENALSHRIQIGFRDAKRWSTSLDVKGGSLDKLINAANSPLICGLGILRRVMNGWTEAYQPPEKREDEENKLRIGGASAITCNLRSLSHQLRIGSINDFFLASVDLNIIHLTRPSAFCIHLHETAHLICGLISSEDCECIVEKKAGRLYNTCYKNSKQIITSKVEQNVLERHQDIFSEILVHFFVFGDDYNTYFRNYLANYSLDSIAYCKNDKDTFRRMFEVLIRGFLITDPFRAKEKYPFLYSMKNEGIISEDKIQQAYQEFKIAVERVGPFFPDFHRLWHGSSPDFEEYLKDKFTRIYRDTYCPLCNIWKDANQIFNGVTKDKKGDAGNIVLGTDLTAEQGADDVKDAIDNALESGRPFARVKFKIADRDHSDEKQGRLDPFFLMRLLLREYITGLFGVKRIDTKEAALWLVRKSDTGKPDLETLPKGAMRWHEQLIDRNCNGLFSVDPETRSDYMRRRIVVIKILWDISTNLRARRLKSMLDRLVF